MDSIRLKLPGTLVVIDGLSHEQHRAVFKHYKSFVDCSAKTSHKADVICCLGRLDQPLRLPIEQFTVNGQYTPLQQRSGAGIAITGFDFVGRLYRNSLLSPVRAELLFAEKEKIIHAGILETFLRILMAHYVLTQGGVLLHSAGVLYKDRVYLFCGRSNAGKTTMTRKAAAAGARVLSDDINLVTPENGEYRAHKVPFAGEFGRQVETLSGCGSLPIGGLVLLEKAKKLVVAPVSPAEAIAGLLVGCPFVNDDPEEIPVLMDVLANLLHHKPVIRMGVALDDSFEAVMAEFLRSYKNA